MKRVIGILHEVIVDDEEVLDLRPGGAVGGSDDATPPWDDSPLSRTPTGPRGLRSSDSAQQFSPPTRAESQEGGSVATGELMSPSGVSARSSAKNPGRNSAKKSYAESSKQMQITLPLVTRFINFITFQKVKHCPRVFVARD